MTHFLIIAVARILLASEAYTTTTHREQNVVRSNLSLFMGVALT